ncbi:MAG: hypothetical protein VYE73_14350 [Acidobacteriota bacterium]|nr:hypothetical protein [Acidobacteriota bacterium]
MNAHPATEVLSAYLDDEFVDHRQIEVESHVEECQGCQHRLDGLRRVVDQLQRVPSARPSMALARGVETHVIRARRSRSIGMSRPWLQIELPHPAVGLGFALTVGFAMMLYFFAQSGAFRAAPDLPDDRSRLIMSPAGPESPLPQGQRVSAGGRSFVLQGDAWLESQLSTAQLPLELPAGHYAELAASHSWLEDLLSYGRDVIFVTDEGETVRVTPQGVGRDGSQPPLPTRP